MTKKLRLSAFGKKMLVLTSLVLVMLVLGVVLLVRSCSSDDLETVEVSQIEDIEADSLVVNSMVMSSEELQESLKAEVVNQYDGDDVEVSGKWSNYLEELIFEESKTLLYGLSVDGYEVERSVIQSGETFSKLLNDKFNVNFTVINELIEKCNGVFDLRDLRAGKPYSVFLRNVTADSVVADYMVYEKSQSEYIVFGTGNDVFVTKGTKDVVVEERYAEGVINSSLYATIYEKGYNHVLAAKLDEIFKWTINFFTLQKGDSFKVLYEEQFIDTVSVGIGTVYGAEFTHKGEVIMAVRFEQGDELGYWDADGVNMRKNFLSAPLQYSYRVSSGYGSRIHPIQGYRKQHNGIDYAAPKGTPILAVADGTATRVGWDSSGGGNRIWLKHTHGLETVYMHLSGFAKGIKAGTRVRQGQVIGYVGSTGASTGAHLHYGVKQNNKYINPNAIPSIPTDPILSANKGAFNTMRDDVLSVMAEYQSK